MGQAIGQAMGPWGGEGDAVWPLPGQKDLPTCMTGGGTVGHVRDDGLVAWGLMEVLPFGGMVPCL